MRCLDKAPTARWTNMSSKCTFVSAPKGVCLGQAFCSEDTVADGSEQQMRIRMAMRVKRNGGSDAKSDKRKQPEAKSDHYCKYCR
jgi:hypothetical protein